MNNIIQWNCHGMRANFNDFRLLCDNYNPIVCFLQETMLTKDDFIIRGFNFIHLTSRAIGGGACVGVSVLVRDGMPYNECPLNTALQTNAVTISTFKTITICSLYLPPIWNLNIVLLTRLIDQLPTPFVVCDDFNGHSMTWGFDKNYIRGDRVDDFITDNNVSCIMMVLIHICTKLQEHSQPLIFLFVLRTFVWILISWLNRIRMVVIIFLLV